MQCYTIWRHENATRIPAHRAGYVFGMRQGDNRTAERPWPALLRVNVSESSAAAVSEGEEMNGEYVSVMWSPVNGVLFAEIVDCVGGPLWASKFWITHNNVSLYVRITS